MMTHLFPRGYVESLHDNMPAADAAAEIVAKTRWGAGRPETDLLVYDTMRQIEAARLTRWLTSGRP